MVFYDFEVFHDDWLLVAIDGETDQMFKIHNSVKKLRSLYESHSDSIWVGYNSRRYDQYILKGILTGNDPYIISRHIIDGGNAGWTYGDELRNIPLINYDVMLGNDPGLKALEGFMGNDIRETSVPFDISRPLTDDEIEETFKYCEHDVRQTIEVFKRRIEEFNTMRFFIEHFGLQVDSYSKTKAQLAAEILGGNRLGASFKDEFDFSLLPCLRLDKYRSIADWYRAPANHDYDKKQETVVAGVPHVFAWGGAHGAREKYMATGTFLNIDVTAYYPSLQMKYGFGRRVMDKWENFEFVHGSNLEYKRRGDKKARQPFKILDNAVSGQLKQPASALYDPRSNNEICINGQLLLLDLIEHLEGTCELIQNNTDGIIVKVEDYDRDINGIRAVVMEWEERTGMAMEIARFDGTIFQKDVNNYLLIDKASGEVKCKGSYVMKLNDLKNELAIVNQAIVEYMTKGTPVQETIEACDDLKSFQLIARISHKFSHILYGDAPLKEKCVRVFASIDQRKPGISKVKSDNGQVIKVQNSPDHCLINNDEVNGVSVPEELDKGWYVELALKRLEDFGCLAAKPAALVKKPRKKKGAYKGAIGVVEGTKSQPKERFKGRDDLKSDEEVANEAGVVKPLNDDIILIDIDNTEQAERLFKIVKRYAPTCTVRRTDRGMHFLFRNRGVTKSVTGKVLPIGLTADIKLGCKNGVEVTRRDGKEREIIHGADLIDSGAYQDVPKWLIPLKNNGDEGKFLNLTEGSRNETLFLHIRRLKQNGFPPVDIETAIRIINEFIFDMPLPEDELKHLLRDVSKTDEQLSRRFYDSKNRFQHNAFGDYFINMHYVTCFRDRAYMYQDGYYTDNRNEIARAITKEVPAIRERDLNEVISYLIRSPVTRMVKTPGDPKYIQFENGIYDISTDLFYDPDPKFFIANKIPWCYNPKAYSKTADDFLDEVSCNDPQIRMVLEELIGLCFYRSSTYSKAIILKGDKSNGKSTFLEMLQNLLGDRNTSSLDIQNLGDRFKTAELHDKLANIGDDIGEGFITDMSVFKKLVTGERLTMEKKGKDPTEFNNYAKLLFSANTIPRTRDKTGAVQRRLIIIPFNAEFAPGKKGFDPKMKTKLKDEAVMEYLIVLGIAGLKRIIAHDGFSDCVKADAELSDYYENNNPILLFIGEDEEDGNAIAGRPTSEVYERYEHFCKQNGLKVMSRKEFSAQVIRHFKDSGKITGTASKRIDGRICRCFV